MNVHTLTLEIQLRRRWLRWDDVVDSLRAHFPAAGDFPSARCVFPLAAWQNVDTRRVVDDSLCTDGWFSRGDTLVARRLSRATVVGDLERPSSSRWWRWKPPRTERANITLRAALSPRYTLVKSNHKGPSDRLSLAVSSRRTASSNPRRSRSVNCAGRRWRATNTARSALHLLCRGKKERRTRDALQTNTAFVSISAKTARVFIRTSFL